MAITAAAWNRPLGHHRSDQLHRPAHRWQLGLQLGDAAFGRDQLDLLGAGQARFKAAVNGASKALRQNA